MPALRLEFPFLWRDRIEGRAKRSVRDQPLPLLLNSYRGHTRSVTCVAYIDEHKLVLRRVSREERGPRPDLGSGGCATRTIALQRQLGLLGARVAPDGRVHQHAGRHRRAVDAGGDALPARREEGGVVHHVQGLARRARGPLHAGPARGGCAARHHRGRAARQAVRPRGARAAAGQLLPAAAPARPPGPRRAGRLAAHGAPPFKISRLPASGRGVALPVPRPCRQIPLYCHLRMASTVPVRRPPTPELVRETRLKRSTLAAKKSHSSHVERFKPGPGGADSGPDE